MYIFCSKYLINNCIVNKIIVRAVEFIVKEFNEENTKIKFVKDKSN